jgi:hypothetical protein
MHNKRILIVLFTAVLTASASSVGLNSVSNATRKVLPSHAHDSERSNVVPDHVVYGFLFHKMELLRQKTKELQAEGRIGQKPYFILKREAGLSEEQSIALEAIALACLQRVKQQDNKAKAIIAAFRSRFPDGRVPADGPPPPPPELKIMWDERNAMILRARDQLRATFGEAEFARFDNYVKFYHGANTSPLTTNPVSGRPRQK